MEWSTGSRSSSPSGVSLQAMYTCTDVLCRRRARCAGPATTEFRGRSSDLTFVQIHWCQHFFFLILWFDVHVGRSNVFRIILWGNEQLTRFPVNAIHTKMEVHVESPLSKMLATRSVRDFRFFFSDFRIFACI